MGWYSIACKVVVDGQLIEGGVLETGDVSERCEQWRKEGREEALMFILIDLVAAVLEPIAEVLHASVVQLLPLPSVQPTQQGCLFLPRHHIFHKLQTLNHTRIFCRTVGNRSCFSFTLQIDTAVQKNEGSAKVLIL